MKKWYFFITTLIISIILPITINADCAQQCGGMDPTSQQKCLTQCKISGGDTKTSGSSSCSTLGISSCSQNSNCEWINNSCKAKGTTSGGNSSGGGNTGGGNTGGGSTGGSSGDAGTGYNGFDCNKCYNESTYNNDEKRSCLVSNGCSIDESKLNSGGTKSKKGEQASYGSGNDKITDLQGCEAVFGEIENGKFISKNSLGYFIQSIFNIVKYIVPIILIVLTIVEFLTAVTSGDKDNITKALKKTYTRLIIVAIIFLVPTLLNLLLSFVTENGTCGIK